LLFACVNTIKTHQRVMYRKLGAANRRDAVEWAQARNLLEQPDRSTPARVHDPAR
jgi:ATP/maltotriose-dependent transcriptional regulator MalT